MRLVDRKHLRRGVLILPSALTLGNLFFGFNALIEAAKGRWASGGDVASMGHFELSALFVLCAMVCDALDGRVARLTHATSPLGLQLDSLADVVSFGVAPGMLVYAWALADLEPRRLGFALAFIFMGCGALRLARFNVQAAVPHDNRFFVGLPIPGAAGALAAVVFQWPASLEQQGPRLAAAALTFALALLMVSTIRYPSFKQVDWTRRQSMRTLLWMVLVLALLGSRPQETLLAVALLFAFSGPVYRGWLMLKRAPAERA